jgi:hypothetical protein
LLVALLAATPAHAEEEESDFWSSMGLGVGAAFSNVVYIPAKVIYASLGGLVGGLAYVLTIGSTETAMDIWEPSMGGTYVLTPKILKGEEPLHFNGRPSEELREYDAQWPG